MTWSCWRPSPAAGHVTGLGFLRPVTARGTLSLAPVIEANTSMLVMVASQTSLKGFCALTRWFFRRVEKEVCRKGVMETLYEWQQVSGLGGGRGADSHAQLPAQRGVAHCHSPYLQRHKKSEIHQGKEKPNQFRNIILHPRVQDETSSQQMSNTFILCNLKAFPSTFSPLAFSPCSGEN